MAKGNETLAYILHKSDDPEERKFGDNLMDNSIKAKRIIKEQTEGWEQKLYLLKAEGHN